MIPNRFYTTRYRLFLAAMICCSLFLAADVFAINDPENTPGKNNLSAEMPSDADTGSATDFPVYLYFADSQNRYLTEEQRFGLQADDPAVFCRNIVDGLISGPAGDLVRTLPSATRIRAIFVDDKTAYVDLSQEVAASHPGGIVSELMTIYSVVNSLVLNVDAVDKVKLLIAGQDAQTVSGHIDIRFPLHADILLIR